ncbi:MAG: diaminopimelate decarboxylase [Lachnospiraceae bacterium]|nr:diaminopimelate decarboxylase [Lachnospiraceae bacterium]
MTEITNQMIQELAWQYKTPLYIFDTDIFGRRFGYYREAFGMDVQINYCMKTNPLLTEASLPYTNRIEVCSYGEFLICKELGVPAKQLLISGVLKKYEDMVEIIAYGKEDALYTAESIDQLEVMNRIAMDCGLKLNVYYRLQWGQFGMDEETILSLLQEDKYRGLVFYGIHYFTGTQKRRLQQFRKELEYLDKFLIRICDVTGKSVEHLEYGPGFGVPYFVDQEEVATVELLQQFRELLITMRWKGAVSIELGRALAYDCGYYVVQIRDIKSSGGKNYCICDGGIHQVNYDGQLRGMYRPIMRSITKKEDELKEQEHYIICGSLCTGNDILLQDYQTTKVQEGDYLVFERTGAYSIYEGMSLFLSHEIPGVCLCNRTDGFSLVRPQQQSYHINTIHV